MYVKIASIEEALDHGGLFIRSQTTPTMWMFLVGTSLADAINKGLMGKHAVNTSNGILVPPQVTVRSVKGKSIIVSGGAIGSNSGDYAYKNVKALQVSPGPSVIADFFDSTDVLEYCGIVTGATDGYGQSSRGKCIVLDGITREQAPTYSYMRTLIPMREKFGVFLDRAHLSALASAPSEVRQYYQRTYATSRVAYVDLRPELAIHTVWKNGALMDGVMPRGNLLQSPNVDSRAVDKTMILPTPVPLSWNGAAHSAVTNISLFDEANWVTVGKFYGSYDWGQGFPEMHQYLGNLGVRSAGASYLPMISENQVGASVEVTNLSGEIEGFNVGQVRDAHTVYKALVTGQRFAAAPQSHATIAEFVAASIARAWPYDPTDGATTDAAAVAVESILTRSDATFNAYEGGPIINAVRMFLATWDRSAYDLAKAEN